MKVRCTRRKLSRESGNAIAETLIALLALAPFIAGIPLLGKQLDIKQKTFEAVRYSTWERVVWKSSVGANQKTEQQITLEARDRILGNPRDGMSNLETLNVSGVTENPLWRDAQQARLVDYDHGTAGVRMELDERQTPVDVGYFFVPGIAHGDGAIAAAGNLLEVEDLDLSRRTYSISALEIGVRPVLADAARTHRTLGAKHDGQTAGVALIQRARGAVLSDTWSAADENEFRRRTDWVTTDELVATLELPSRPIASMARAKGELLYGEGQFAWDPDLQPSSTTLPKAYLRRK